MGRGRSSAGRSGRSRAGGAPQTLSFSEFKKITQPVTNEETRAMSFDRFIQDRLGFDYNNEVVKVLGGSMRNSSNSTARTSGQQSSAWRRVQQANRLKSEYNKLYPAQTTQRGINPESKRGQAWHRARYRRYLRSQGINPRD